MLDRSVTRIVFEGLSPEGELLFYVLATLSIGVFFAGLTIKLRKYLRGRREDRIGSWRGFLAGALRGLGAAAANTTVRKRDPFAGLFHAAVMWGFVVLFIGTAILTIDTDIVGIVAPQYHFFWGAFYVVYSFVLDALGVVMIVGLAAMAYRRARMKKPQLDYGRVDLAEASTDRRGFLRGDRLFLGWLLVLGVTGYIVEGVRIAQDDFPWFEVFAPVGYVLGRAFAALGVGGGTAPELRLALWWGHALLALGFVAYIPFSKAFHMLGDPVNLALRSPLAGPAGGRPGRRTPGPARPRRLQLEAAPRLRQLHQVRPLPRRLPGRRLGGAALAARSRPRPASAGRRRLGGPGAGARASLRPRLRERPHRRAGRRRTDRAPDALVLHHLPRLRGGLPGRHRARAGDRGDAPLADRPG